MAGRPPTPITLTGNERETLERWSRRQSTAQNMALRCRIVLAAADGMSSNDIAADLACNPATVSKWRTRFAQGRIDALKDAARPGAVRTVADDAVEAVIVDSLETTPADATHWSTRDLAAKHGLSQSTVSRIWRAFGLKPWLADEFKISPDPELIEKLRDIVGLYLSPPVAAAVFTVDEKPGIQAINRTAPTPPMLPTTPQRATHDYQRNGTISLDPQDPQGAALAATPPPVHLHFTPTYSSWVNLVERWFSALTTKLLQRSAHDTVKELTDDINNWIEIWNTDPKPYIWTKTADEILDKLARYCGALTTPNNSPDQ